MAEAATIARPYAKAAFLSARDTQALPAWTDALRQGAGLAADASIEDLITNPKMSIDQIVSIFAGLSGADDAVDQRWQNFVRLLATNKRLHVLGEIAVQYEMLRAQYENELDVQLTSAVVLSAQQQHKLAAALNKRFKREIRLTTAVDPSLLGGAVIHAGDLVIDGSISGRLQRLAADLVN